MSKNVMDRLAAANPISPLRHPRTVTQSSASDIITQAELTGSGLEERHGARRRQVWVAILAAVAAITVGVFSLTLGGSRGSSIVAEAYAATSSTGQILVYETSTFSPGVDVPNDYAARYRSGYRVWTSGHRFRQVGTEVIGGAPGHPRFSVSHEVTLNGTRLEIWQPSPSDPAGTIANTRTSNHSTCSVSNVLNSLASPFCGGPLQAVRTLYRSKALHLTGRTIEDGQKVDVLAGETSEPKPGDFVQHVRVLVDASTFTPIEVQFSSIQGPETTTTFGHFTRLPLTAINRRLLRMSAHPGAQVIQLPPIGVARLHTTHHH